MDFSPVTPTPIIPSYSGANVRGILPALLGPAPWNRGLPDWIPAPVAGAERVVLLVLDGLGWRQFIDHRDHMPRLGGFAGTAIHTVAPTTTATALCSITTGLTPGEHGLVGYRITLGGDVMNVLRWMVDTQSVRRSHPPRDVQPFQPFLDQTVPVISPTELQNSAFSEAHLRGSRAVGYRAASSIAVTARDEALAGEKVIYCYYGGIDKIAHERGFGNYYEAELRAADHIVGELLDMLPTGTVLLVTADHGQVEVGDRIIHPSRDLLGAVTLQSGEGRFRWLHCRSHDVHAVLEQATSEVGDVAWVVSKEQMLDEAWFGPTVAPPIRSRIGDVALVARDDVSFHDANDSGPFALMCRHGSLTAAEVEVPLLAMGV